MVCLPSSGFASSDRPRRQVNRRYRRWLQSGLSERVALATGTRGSCDRLVRYSGAEYLPVPAAGAAGSEVNMLILEKLTLIWLTEDSEFTTR